MYIWFALICEDYCVSFMSLLWLLYFPPRYLILTKRVICPCEFLGNGKFKISSTNRGRWKYTYLAFNMDLISVNFLVTYPLHFFLEVATLSYVLTVGGWKTLKVPTISIKWGILSFTMQNENVIVTAKKT